jgi:hypothetical protein
MTPGDQAHGVAVTRRGTSGATCRRRPVPWPRPGWDDSAALSTSRQVEGHALRCMCRLDIGQVEDVVDEGQEFIAGGAQERSTGLVVAQGGLGGGLGHAQDGVHGRRISWLMLPGSRSWPAGAVGVLLGPAQGPLAALRSEMSTAASSSPRSGSVGLQGPRSWCKKAVRPPGRAGARRAARPSTRAGSMFAPTRASSRRAQELGQGPAGQGLGLSPRCRPWPCCRTRTRRRAAPHAAGECQDARGSSMLPAGGLASLRAANSRCSDS